MKKTMSLMLIVVILFSTFVLAAPTATRSIEGNKVTVSLKGMASNSGEVNEILVGGVILTGMVPAGCDFNANGGVADTKLKCIIQTSADTTISYQTSGSGTVSGTFSYFVAPTAHKITIAGDSIIPQTAACGNNIIETGEECDNTKLNDQTCTSLGAGEEGTLSCTSECKFDKTQCTSATLCPPNIATGNVPNCQCLDTAATYNSNTNTCESPPALSPEICNNKMDDDQDDKIDCKDEDCGNDATCAPPTELKITAKDNREKQLFLKIQEALSTNDSILKKVSAIAGAFKCFFDNKCNMTAK